MSICNKAEDLDMYGQGQLRITFLTSCFMWRGIEGERNMLSTPNWPKTN